MLTKVMAIGAVGVLALLTQLDGGRRQEVRVNAAQQMAITAPSIGALMQQLR